MRRSSLRIGAANKEWAPAKRKGLPYPMPTKAELGRRLRIARFDRNMTLKEVANRCGMSATHISEVERGKTSPTIGALQRIAKALDQRSSYFLQEDGMPRVLVTRKEDRCDYYLTDKSGHAITCEVVSPGISSGYLQIFVRTTKPGEVSQGVAIVAEIVFLCLRGMTKITVQGESNVLREGDTLQTRIDSGYVAENIGDEENEVMAVYASPVLIPVM
jgi:transcriptional regulator with XRE-family HTH domain